MISHVIRRPRRHNNPVIRLARIAVASLPLAVAFAVAVVANIGGTP